MPTFPHRHERTPVRGGTSRPTRRAPITTVLVIFVLGVATASAQTCTTSWDEFRIVNYDGTRTAEWSDPTSPFHHALGHLPNSNAMLAAADGPRAYLDALLFAARNLFGNEYAYIAEQMGLKSVEEAIAMVGFGGLRDFVNFDDAIEVGSSESGAHCANLYGITDGAHEGELLLIVRDAKTDRIKHMEVVANEDSGRARAHQVMRELERVMLDPDGCGDMRVGEGC